MSSIRSLPFYSILLFHLDTVANEAGSSSTNGLLEGTRSLGSCSVLSTLQYRLPRARLWRCHPGVCDLETGRVGKLAEGRPELLAPVILDQLVLLVILVFLVLTVANHVGARALMGMRREPGLGNRTISEAWLGDELGLETPHHWRLHLLKGLMRSLQWLLLVGEGEPWHALRRLSHEGWHRGCWL